MKRAVAFLLACAMALCLAACGGETSSTTGNSSDSLSAPGASPLIPDGPAPEVNLITGQALTDGLVPGDRPVAVMVDNSRYAIPQRGIGAADAIFEMVTEGGVTRLMALYADKDTVPDVGPVRSARDQYLQFAMPMNALIVHIGTSIYAENLLSQYQYDTINGMYLGSTAFRFDEGRDTAGYANEHCWYTDAGLIAAGIAQRGLAVEGSSQPLFDFRDHNDQPVAPAAGNAADVGINFSDYAAVHLTYDSASGTYLKTAYDAPHIDESTGAQLAFQNVLVLFTDIALKNPADPNNLVTDFAMTGGTGYYCYGGKYQPITWQKGAPENQLHLLDADGQLLQVNVGKSYVAVVGNDRASLLTFDGVSPIAVAPVLEQTDPAASGSSVQEPEL